MSRQSNSERLDSETSIGKSCFGIYIEKSNAGLLGCSIEVEQAVIGLPVETWYHGND